MSNTARRSERAHVSTASVRIRCFAVALAAVAIVSASCADQGSGAAPAAGVLTTEGPPDVPLFPGTRLVGTPSEAANTSTWSYATERGDPAAILDWYTERLDGWTVTEPSHSIGAGPQLTARGTWAKQGSSLLITAELAPGIDDDRTVQYNLLLTGG